MPAPRADIGIDCRMLGRAGIGRYIQELLRPLVARSDYSFIFFKYPEQEFFFEDISPQRTRLVDVRSKIYSLSEQWEMKKAAESVRLFHAPHFNYPLKTSSRLVVTIHDLIYLTQAEYRKDFARRLYIEYLLKKLPSRVGAVLTVSGHSKKTLLQHVKSLNSDKIYVTWEASSKLFVPRGSDDPNSGRPPFILFVGGQKRHKNLAQLIAAVQRLREKQDAPYELLCAGKKDPANRELNRQIEESPFVHVRESVSDPELVRLYQEAEAVVLPSLEEGFGLPAVEAMACARPLICSNRGSLPEIAADAALYFDPGAPDAIDALTRLLYTVLKDKDLQRRMSQKSLLRSAVFSWEKTADATLQCYGRVLSEGGALP